MIFLTLDLSMCVQSDYYFVVVYRFSILCYKIHLQRTFLELGIFFPQFGAMFVHLIDDVLSWHERDIGRDI